VNWSVRDNRKAEAIEGFQELPEFIIAFHHLKKKSESKENEK
jgi:hypothetical protein